jgi:16S rRNA (uracil1498-N3)-methyltransferase
LGAMTPQKTSGELRLILEPEGAEQDSRVRSIEAAGAPIARAEIAIGPEGGFSPEELDAFQLSAFARLGLGPRILRTETAAIAAIIMLQTRFGDMSANPADSSRSADA